MLEGVNLWAVLVAGVSAFVLGGLWYAPFFFGRAWMNEAKLTDAEVAAANPARVYGLSLLLSLLAAFIFAMFLGPAPALGFAVGAGLMAGAFWVGASFGINYLFEQKSLRHFLVNAGYHTVQFTLYGAILGAWHI